jgi:hypothetical protein
VDTIEAAGLFIHPAASMLGRGDNGVYIKMDVPADLVLRKGAENGDVVKVVK